MGTSSSTGKGQKEGEGEEEWQERCEEESLAGSTGVLPMLQKAFSKLSLPETKTVPLNSLEEVFSLNFTCLQSESLTVTDCFPCLLANIGPTMVDLFFKSDNEGVSWVGFLKGFNRCSGRMPASVSLTILCKIYSVASGKADNPTELGFDSVDNGGKMTGSFLLNDVLMLLWMCWAIQDARKTTSLEEKSTVVFPDIYHLLSSAFISCCKVGDEAIENIDIVGLEEKIPAQQFLQWILTTIPGLANCISEFVQVRLQALITTRENVEISSSSTSDDSSAHAHNTYLLTRGRAWAISLSLRSVMDELLEVCLSRRGTGTIDNLLYRSTENGKGLNRFWSSIEGYHGPLLVLVCISTMDSAKDKNAPRKRVVGILTEQGFENRDNFYGNSGYLFAVSPIFHVFPASGKSKNFMYCHLNPGRAYDPQPKPVGVAFGGTVGNERIFIDEDFAEVIIRHHAVDKTYLPGSLIPNQGFLPTAASVLDVEVWGLGGTTAKQRQDAYKKRETLFSEQRRKVDLKTFGTWEDSPEKMMMDMVSDRNRVGREDR